MLDSVTPAAPKRWLPARLWPALLAALVMLQVAGLAQALPVRDPDPQSSRGLLLSSFSKYKTLHSLDNQESSSCVPETRVRGFAETSGPASGPGRRLKEELIRVCAFVYDEIVSGRLVVSNNPINFRDPLGLYVYPTGFIGPIGPDDSRMPVAPPGASVDANIAETEQRVDPFWFRNKVRNKGPWDYKQRGRKYADFGNFNYGACGKAFGFSELTLRNEAGIAQIAAGTSKPAWPGDWGRPGPHLYPELGIPPYGDAPEDQYWIGQGIDYYFQTLFSKHPDTSPDWNVHGDYIFEPIPAKK